MNHNLNYLFVYCKFVPAKNSLNAQPSPMRKRWLNSKNMTRTFIVFLVCILTACNNSVSKRENLLAKEMSVFLVSGKYDVQIVEGDTNKKSTKSTNEQLTLTNNLGLIEFKGSDSFTDLDSISISLNDSTLLRQFSVNHFIDTVSVSAAKSGIDKDYFGYAFGKDNSGGIVNIPEFRQFFNEGNVSGSQALFIIGWTKEDNDITIRQIERVVSSGKILLNVNKTFILTPNYFSQ